MSEVENLKIEDVCTFIGGSQPPKSVFSDIPREGYVRLVQIRDFKNENFPTYIPKDSTSKFFGKKDIMIGRYGPPIFQILRGLEGAYNVALLKAKPKSNIFNDYLYYFLQQKDLFEYVDKLSPRTGGQTGVDLASLNKYPIRLPSLPTQQKIAKVLSDLDAKIELNNRINAELEAMAKLVYEYWFVQFDFPFASTPLSTGAQGKPDQNGKPYKSSGGKMVWNEELKREIPEGWEVHPVDYWIQNDKNGDWGKEEIEGNYDLRVSCIRGADINGLNGNGELKSPVRYILEKNSHKILEPGDLVIEISGGSPTQSTGRLGYIINETLERFNEPLICSNFCKAITLKDESNLFNFIYEWKRLYDAGIFFGYEGKTSGIKNFLFESFVSKHRIVIPPQELTEKFYEKVLPIHSKIQKNLIQNQELSNLRDWLLPMLMNGQVRLDGLGDLVVEAELGMVAEPQETYQTKPSKG